MPKPPKLSGKDTGRIRIDSKTFSKLMKQLNSSSAKKRLQAITELSKIGESNPEQIVGVGTTLIGCLQDIDAGVRRYAAYTLGLLGKLNPDYVRGAIQPLIACLQDFDVGVRQHAAYAIGYIGKVKPEYVQNAIPALIKCLEHPVEMDMGASLAAYQLRTSAVGALNSIGENKPELIQSAIASMLKSLKYPVYRPENPHPDADKLYASVIYTLGNIGQKKPEIVQDAVPILVKCFVDAWSFTRWRNNAEDKNGMVQRCMQAIEKIGTVNPRLVLPSLLKCLGDENENVRLNALNLINKLSGELKQIIPPLVDCITNPDTKVRHYASFMLDKFGKSHPEQIIPLVTKGLNSPNEEVRRYAAHALGRFGDMNPGSVKDAIPSLIRCLKDPDITVRQYATEALGIIGALEPEYVKDAIYDIIERLKDPSGNVRWSATCALERVGEAKEGSRYAPDERIEYVRPAIPALIDVHMNDPYDHVRWRATYALQKFGVNVTRYHEALEHIRYAESLVTDLKKFGADIGEPETLLERSKSAVANLDYDEAIELAKRTAEATKRAREGTPIVIAKGTTLDKLYANTWVQLNIKFTNAGSAVAKNIMPNFSPFFEPQGIRSIPELKVGDETEMTVGLNLRREGKTPLEIILTYDDVIGRQHKIKDIVWLNIMPKPPKVEPLKEPIKIFDLSHLVRRTNESEEEIVWASEEDVMEPSTLTATSSSSSASRRKK